MNMIFDTDELINTGNEIRLTKEEINNLMLDIERLVLSVNGDWQGDSEREFAHKLIYVKSQFSHISDFFDNYTDTLKKIAKQCEIREDEFASKINLV